MADDSKGTGAQTAPAAQAPSPAAGPPLPAFEAGEMYKVQLKAPMHLGQTLFAPMHDTYFDGDFCKTIADNIASAEKQ